MGTEYGFRVDSLGPNWNGQQQSGDAKRQGRLLKLKALLDALKAGNLEASVKALGDLWAFEPHLRSDGYLQQIADALNRKQIYFAQKAAAAMQADITHFAATLGMKSKPAQSAQPVQLTQPQRPSVGTQTTVSIPDMGPKKATSGEFGRLIDVSA